MKKTFQMISLFMIVMVVLVGCGGGSVQPVEVAVKLTDFAFDPVSIQAGVGAEITINLDNQGALEHNFIVMNQGVNLTDWADTEQSNVFFEQLSLPTGQTSTATFTAPTEPGTYQFLCSVPGHLTQGMQGTLTVTP
jgi:uncharacterized cupredoxin-like copper-binding protein